MNFKTIYKQPPISDRTRAMGFGKYRDLTIEEIMDFDCQYLHWLHHNNDFFELDAALLEEVETNGKEQIDAAFNHAIKGFFNKRFDF